MHPHPNPLPEYRERGQEAVGLSLNRLGIRNATRNTGRSVLAVGLIAFAAFTLVTVASMKEGPPDDTHDPKSGAGGYRLIVQADIPLLADPSTVAGRESLGLDDPAAPIWDRVKFTAMRSWAGQDISCLNLTRPTQPTILAVPPSMVARNAFDFAAAIANVDNRWTLLDKPMPDEKDVPVVTDAETAQYILHQGLGGAMPITDQLGRPRNLRLVGTLKHSIFQGEMLMSEANFLKLFPSQAGFGTVLVETSADDEKDAQRRLATGLEENAAVVDRTADRLAVYAQVKNTYLSTFQTLGSLGLMLGTVGLAVVLLRSLVERRGELALLTALGFRPGARTRLVLGENAFLLLLGLLVGTGCAVLGVSPTLFSSDRTVNVTALALTMLAVLAIGLVGLALAVSLGQRRIKPADLRAE
jgi:putative ABC transport system permease protein